MTHEQAIARQKMLYEVRMSWRQWIALEAWGWNWYVALTFPDIVSVESANKAFKIWVPELNIEMYGYRLKRQGDIELGGNTNILRQFDLSFQGCSVA